MQTSISIANQDFTIVEYKGKPVLTLAMIDKMHERKEGTASRNFVSNKSRFTSEKHFYHIDYAQNNVLRCFGINIPPRGLIALTERGYLLLVKLFTDDKAWEVQEKLIDGYFRAKPPKQEVEVSGSITLNQQPLSLPYQPLSDKQQYGLRNEVNKRAKQAGVHPLRIYAALKQVYEVTNYRDISSDKYTEAKGLVRSMVLNGEVMPREQATPATIKAEQLEGIRAMLWESVTKGLHALSELDELKLGGAKATPAPKAIKSERVDPLARAAEELKARGEPLPAWLRSLGYC